MTLLTDPRRDVIARYIHVGCILDDLPGTLQSATFHERLTVVYLDADIDAVTDVIGQPEVFAGTDGTVHIWSHPEGFEVRVFTPREAA
jgi:hypothetical protein